ERRATEMTREEKRIKIAEACGWKFMPTHDNGFGKAVPEKWLNPDGFEFYEDLPIPDYYNDLNAIHKAEMALGDDAKSLFKAKLSDLLGDDCRMGWAIHATAAQR